MKSPTRNLFELIICKLLHRTLYGWHFWPFLTIFDQFKNFYHFHPILTIFGIFLHFFTIFRYVDHCWPLFTIFDYFDYFWPFLSFFDHFCPFLTILIPFNNFQPFSTIFKTCPKLVSNLPFGPLSFLTPWITMMNNSWFVCQFLTL